MPSPTAVGTAHLLSFARRPTGSVTFVCGAWGLATPIADGSMPRDLVRAGLATPSRVGDVGAH